MTTSDYAATLAFPRRHATPPRVFPFRIHHVVAGALALMAVLFLSTTTMSASQPRQITVHSGDTLWSIAQSADPGGDIRSDIDRIITLNRLQSASVYPGEKLVLPQF